MSTFSVPLTRMIHENLSLVMEFCFSRHTLEELMETRFSGEWKYLNNALFHIGEQRAERACIELALFIRLLDDQQKITDYFKQTRSPIFGRLVMKDKPDKELIMRDFTNKVIHARAFEWDFSDPRNPRLLCESHATEKWVRAEVEIVAVAAFCGMLMS